MHKGVHVGKKINNTGTKKNKNNLRSETTKHIFKWQKTTRNLSSGRVEDGTVIVGIIFARFY